MKKLISVLFLVTAATSFTEIYEKNERYEVIENKIENRLYMEFPTLEPNGKIFVKDIGVDIEKNGMVEVEVEFDKSSEINIENYEIYADKIADTVNKIIQEIGDKKILLREVEIDTSGIEGDERIFRY